MIDGVQDVSQDILADRAVGDLELSHPVVSPICGFGHSVLALSSIVQDSVEFVEKIVSVLDAESSVTSKRVVDVAKLSIDLQVGINLGLEGSEFSAVSASDDNFVVSSILSGPVSFIGGHKSVEVAGVKTVSDHPRSDLGDEP